MLKRFETFTIVGLAARYIYANLQKTGRNLRNTRLVDLFKKYSNNKDICQHYHFILFLFFFYFFPSPDKRTYFSIVRRIYIVGMCRSKNVFHDLVVPHVSYTIIFRIANNAEKFYL